MNESERTSSAWRPVIEGAAAEEILEIVCEIGEALRTPPTAWIPDGLAEPYRIVRGASLAHGSPGLALFFAYLSQAFKDNPVFTPEVGRFISHARDAMDIAPLSGGLYGGISGIGWVIAHVEHLRDFIYEGISGSPTLDININVEINRLLVEDWSQSDKFDLWDGCVGMGLYALERHPLPGSEELLELTVKRLERLASRETGGIAWLTSPGMLGRQARQLYPRGYYDLGVAHGITGVLSFLSRVHAAGIARDITRELLDGAIAWLLAQELDDPVSIFPEILVPSQKMTSKTFGWCRGVPGMAAALLSAGRCMNEPSWRSKAVDIACKSLEYLAKIVHFPDSTLCHGTAGLAHLYNRIYQASGEPRLKDAARRLIEQTVKMRKPGHGAGGYMRTGAGENGGFAELDDPGLIQGTAGIALVLLAAVTNLEPQWDRLMLISSPAYPVSGAI
jgi:lantibiotic modifying enzyme